LRTSKSTRSRSGTRAVNCYAARPTPGRSGDYAMGRGGRNPIYRHARANAHLPANPRRCYIPAAALTVMPTNQLTVNRCSRRAAEIFTFRFTVKSDQLPPIVRDSPRTITRGLVTMYSKKPRELHRFRPSTR
jgi:hypothetical protein